MYVCVCVCVAVSSSSDEMVLCNPVQAIALLAHLAVEKGVWCQHLIDVCARQVGDGVEAVAARFQGAVLPRLGEGAQAETSRPERGPRVNHVISAGDAKRSSSASVGTSCASTKRTTS